MLASAPGLSQEDLKRATQMATLLPAPTFQTEKSVPAQDKDLGSQGSISKLEENLDFLANSKRKVNSSASKSVIAKQILQKIEEKAGGTNEDSRPVKCCNCKKSKCLKLYCECFANNRFCGPECSCVSCNNLVDYEGVRLAAKESILVRNPLAFQPKI